MSYVEIKPHPLLRPYIDAYWTIRTEQCERKISRIMPDGCIDIIVNMGDDVITENEGYKLGHGSSSLVGTMTIFKDVVQYGATHLVGVRFRPLGISSFYDKIPIALIANTSVEFAEQRLADRLLTSKGKVEMLDSYFLQKLKTNGTPLRGVLQDINSRKGIIRIEELAADHFKSPRQLERLFKQYIGVSPKQYLNFVRCRHAHHQITQVNSRHSLLGVACDTGFYDHAHLSHEMKRFYGYSPSQLLKV